MSAPGIGFVSIDGHGYWPGGRYIMHHLIRALALLPDATRPPMRDVWWLAPDAQDTTFADVRDIFGASAVIHPPTSLSARLWRKARHVARGTNGFADLFRQAGVDVLFPTSACERSGVPLIYYLPDFQHRRLPELHTPELAAKFEDNLRRKCAEAELVVLTSQDALDDFNRYLPEFRDKGRLLRCTSVPRPEWFAREPTEVAREKGLGARFFLICNQFTAHKNHLAVFEAVRRLKARGEEVTLACTGHPVDYKASDFGARLVDFIDANGLRDNIRLLGFLPREEQMALFRGATAIVQPSLFEGWSTPAEDAKALARPIIMSDIVVHREKLDGMDATLVPPGDSDAWSAALLAHRDHPHVVDAGGERAAIEAARSRALACAHIFVDLTREAVARHAQRSRRK